MLIFLISCGRQAYDKESKDTELDKTSPQVQEDFISPYPVSDATMQELEQFMSDLQLYHEDLMVSYRLLIEKSKDMQDVLRRESMGYLTYSVGALLESTNGLILLLELEAVHGEGKQFNAAAINQVIHPLIFDTIRNIDSEMELRKKESELGKNPFFAKQIDTHLVYLDRFKKIINKIAGELPPFEAADDSAQDSVQKQE
jgi:hypothetical protein